MSTTHEHTGGPDNGPEAAGFLESGRHPVSVGHLVMGIAFLGLVAVWGLIQGDVVEGGEVRWLMPVPWVLAGVAGLVATTLTARRHATTRTGWVDTRTDD